MLLHNLFVLVSLDLEVPVTLDLLILVTLDDEVIVTDLFIGFVAANEYAAIVLDPHVHVLFGIDEDLFFTFRVVKPPLVESFSAFGAVGLDAADFIIFRMFWVWAFAKIRRHLVSVVDSANDNRLIRVAFEKIHHDFVPDTRPKRGAPAFARPGLCNSHPA